MLFKSIFPRWLQKLIFCHSECNYITYPPPNFSSIGEFLFNNPAVPTHLTTESIFRACVFTVTVNQLMVFWKC